MIQPHVGVLDHGSGNLHSACRALTAAGATVRLVQRAADLGNVSALVLPGVGAFSATMTQLESVGADELVRHWVDEGRKLFGICVGHQVLFAHGVEHGVPAEGIGVFPGTVEMLHARRLPHMGWNSVEVPSDPGVFRGLDGRHFYFVHSYAAHERDLMGQLCVPDDARVTWCDHQGDRFIAAVQWRNVTSTQFHPEKSAAAGLGLLRNWLMS